MKRKHWLWIVIALCVAGGVIVAAQTTQIGRGLLRGEAFFDGRPASYWREVLRADGEAGHVSEENLKALRTPAAIPVLIECFEDDDRNVRWPAVNILGHLTGPIFGFNQRALPTIRKALHDEDMEVRLQAVLVAERMGPNAQPIAPDLEQLLSDPESQVSHNAELALWEVSPVLARTAGGWKLFPNARWGFSAQFPEPPIEKKSTSERWGSEVVIHSFSATHRVTNYTVGVSEYDQAVLEAMPQKDRYDSARDEMAAALGGELAREEPVEQNGLSGRQYEFDFRGTHVVRTRLFWKGNRLYQVAVTLSREFSSEKAGEYFLNSFKLDDGK